MSFCMHANQILSFEFFQKIPPSQAEEIIANSETIIIDSGQILFQENETDPFFYFVLDGEILIFKQEKELAVRKAGEYFGEMALIDNQPRAAGARALTQSTLLKIGQDSLDLLIATSPEFSKNLLQTLVSRTRDDLGELNLGYKKLKVQKKKTSSLNRILDDTINEIYIFDQTSLKISQMNKRSLNNLGYTPNEVKQLTPLDILAETDEEKLHDLLNPLVAESQTQVAFEGRQTRKDGTTYPVEIRFQLMETEPDIKLVAIVQDITERVKMERKIRQLAYFDYLTSLPNRNSLLEDIQNLEENSGVDKIRLGLFHIDLDEFKRVNDSLGHQGGDILLKEVSKRLTDEFSPVANIYRLQGDEFAVLMPCVDSTESAIRFAEVIMQQIDNMFSIHSFDIHLTCSIGIALFPFHGNSATTLVENADLALTRSKQLGKNQYSFYESSLEPLALNKLALVSGIKNALEKNHFYLLYQAKVDARTKQIVGAEALVRWDHPAMGSISPGKFIPIAEESGLIIPIGEWILRKACSQLKKWHNMGFTDFTLSINFSGIQFSHEGAVDLVKEIVESPESADHGIELELTESIIMEDTDEALKKLKDFRNLGLLLTIDDFGTGYSSMKYLKDMPLHCLKIDQCFVRGIETKSNQAIVKTIVNLAKMLDLKTVAEGVETREEDHIIEMLGCDLIQGYLYSKPVSPEALEEMLEQQMKTTAG